MTSSTPLRLKTLGGALVEGPDGPVTGAITQRRRLALLSLLAASSGGLSRDRIVGMLWPESDEDRARHTLSQLLHGLRRELGGEAFDGSATTVRLNPDVLSSDVQDFTAAISRGDYAQAAELYDGAFLDGFYLNDCPDFERWVDERRAVLARQAEDAMEALATQATSERDHIRAVEWWRRLAALRPLDSRIALALMQAMDASGDRAGALQHARVHDALVREELDAPPPAAIGDYVEALRSAPPPSLPMPVPSSPLATTFAAASVADRPRDWSDDDRPRPISRQTPVGLMSFDLPAPRPTRVRKRGWVIVAAAVAGVALILGLRNGGRPAGSPRSIIIADVENATKDPVFDRTVPVALAATLQQSSRIRVMPPDRISRTVARMRQPSADSVLSEKLARDVAVRDGVPMVAVPTISRAGESYELTARIINAQTGAPLQFVKAHAARREDVLDALDQLARDLRRQLGESRLAVSNSVALPIVTTASLEALKKFADADRALRASHLDDAAALFTEATKIDTSFAMAYANLGFLGYWTSSPSRGDSNFARALSHIGSLPERDQVLIRAAAKSWPGDRAGSAAILRAYLESHPEDYGARSAMGYDYFRMGHWSDAVEAYHKVLTVDSMDYTVWINLASAEKGLGHYDETLRAYKRAFALEPAQLTANNNLNLEYAATYVRLGKLDSAAAVIGLLAAQRDAPRRSRALRSQAFLATYVGHFAEAAQKATEAINMVHGPGSGVTEIRNRLLLATILGERGLTADASRQLDSAYAIVTHIDAEPTLLYWVGKALARAGDTKRTAQLLQMMEPKIHAGSATDRAAIEALHGELLVAQSKFAEAMPHLESAVKADSGSVVLESFAYGAATAGSLERAAMLYEQLGRVPTFGSESQYYTRLAPYWLGRVHERLGNPPSAKAAYERFISGWPQADPELHTVIDAKDRLARIRAGERRG